VLFKYGEVLVSTVQVDGKELCYSHKSGESRPLIRLSGDLCIQYIPKALFCKFEFQLIRLSLAS